MPRYFVSQVVSMGRITIPKQVRAELGIEEGDYVQVQDIKKLNAKPEGTVDPADTTTKEGS